MVVHGEHCLVDRFEGDKSTKCERFTASHMGWKWLVMGRCIVRAKASRAKWKVSFHRRKLLQRAAMKEAAGAHTANGSRRESSTRGGPSGS
eukprot:15746209-Heterocapsa_arctica.AAC.1